MHLLVKGRAMNLREAVKYLESHSKPAEKEYLDACKIIALRDNRATLRHRVFFLRPDGIDPRWDTILSEKVSTALCRCTKLRVFNLVKGVASGFPHKLSSKFVTLGEGQHCLLGPSYGPLIAAYMRCSLSRKEVLFNLEPVKSNLSRPPSIGCRTLDELFSATRGGPIEIAPLDLPAEGLRDVPVARIFEVSPKENFVTLQLGRNVEVIPEKREREQRSFALEHQNC